MKLEQQLSDAEVITTHDRLNEILEKPRDGTKYIYHRGEIAIDKLKNKDLKYISFLVNRFAEKKLLMPFQKRLKEGYSIYFFVR